MSYRPPKKQPAFADLKAILSQTQLDNATYQVMQTLIERLGQYQTVVNEELNKKGTGDGVKGDKGDKGDPGTGVVIKGSVPDSGSLPPTGNEPGDGWIASDTGHLWVWDGDSWVDAGLIQGPPGETGPPGATGPQGPIGPTGPASTVPGPQGPKGDTGNTGATGPQGPIGNTGPTGPASTVPGPAGPEGPQGPKGDTGAASTVPGPAGPQGPIGNTGPQGPIGNTGATGPTGATGSQGPQGIPGRAGEQWFTGTGTNPPPEAGQIVGDWYLQTTTGDYYECTNVVANTWILRGNLKGPQGIQGATGATGSQGPIGNTGATGSQGPKGDTGNTGAQGIQGPAGPTGSTGSQGPAGSTGPAGTPGERWYAFNANPGSGGEPLDSIVGDWYLNTATGDVFEKTAAPNTWTLRGNIKGPIGATGTQGPQGIQGPIGNTGSQGVQGTPGEKWFSGSGVPAGSLAGTIVGDWYLNTANGDVYEKTATTTWTLRANIRGPQGIQGIQGVKGDTGDTGPQGPSGTVGVHAASHRPGGADPLVNNAWTDTANIFTLAQTIQESNGPQLKMIDTSRPVDKKLWRIQNIGENLQFHATNDAITVNSGSVTFDRLGSISTGGNVSASNLYAGNYVTAKRAVIDGGSTHPYSQLEISATGHPGVVLTYSPAAVDFKKARVLHYNQRIRFDFVNDSEGANVGSTVEVDRNGAIYERSRTIAMGEWVSLPNSAADYTSGVGGSSFTLVAQYYRGYTIIGKTMIYSAHFDATIAGATNIVYVALPPGYTALGYTSGTFIYASGVVGPVGTGPGLTTISMMNHPIGQTNMIQGAGMRFTFTIAFPIN